MALLDPVSAGATTALRWGLAVATELVLLPVTLTTLRQTMGDLSALPDALERLRDELGEARDLLGRHVPPVSEVVVALGPSLEALAARLHEVADGLDPVLPKADRVLGDVPPQLTRVEATVTEVGRHLDELRPKLEHLELVELQRRVHHLDDVVEELSETLTAVLSSIPGVRRSLSTG